MSVTGKLVVIAGATSASGLAAVRELTSAGARVIAVGRDPSKLNELLGVGAGSAGDDTAGTVRTEVCDLTDEQAVALLAHRIHATDGAVDGVLHLVGGWRGGGGIEGQSDADFYFLERSFTALRHVSRAFDADLRGADAGRLAVVSSTAVAHPLAGGANYAAVKAASEAWVRAIAQGFAKDARDAGRELNAASVIFRVKALDGLEAELARLFAELWELPASEINGTIVELAQIGHP